MDAADANRQAQDLFADGADLPPAEPEPAGEQGHRGLHPRTECLARYIGWQLGPRHGPAVRAALAMQPVLGHMWPDDRQLRDLVAGCFADLFPLVDGQGRMAGPAALRPVVVDLIDCTHRPQLPMMPFMA